MTTINVSDFNSSLKLYTQKLADYLISKLVHGTATAEAAGSVLVMLNNEFISVEALQARIAFDTPGSTIYEVWAYECKQNIQSYKERLNPSEYEALCTYSTIFGYLEEITVSEAMEATREAALELYGQLEEA